MKRRMENYWLKIKSLWKNKRLLRICIYLFLCLFLFALSDILYIATRIVLEYYRLPFLQVKLWGIGALFLFILSLCLLFFLGWKLLKEAGIKNLLKIGGALYILAIIIKAVTTPVYYNWPRHITASAQAVTDGIFVLLTGIAQVSHDVPDNLQFQITGKRDPIQVPGGVPWVNGVPPTPIVVSAPHYSNFSFCENIAVDKPYEVGEIGLVSLIHNEDKLYNSTDFLSEPVIPQTDYPSVAFEEGTILTFKDGPVTTDDVRFNFWKVGTGNQDGWCMEEVSITPTPERYSYETDGYPDPVDCHREDDHSIFKKGQSFTVPNIVNYQLQVLDGPDLLSGTTAYNFPSGTKLKVTEGPYRSNDEYAGSWWKLSDGKHSGWCEGNYEEMYHYYGQYQ